jgi:16S rRNA (guanine966-N2)-methyltransferase
VIQYGVNKVCLRGGRGDSLRVIAGEFKGVSLQSPKGDVRPTTDRVKESMFNLMGIDLGRMPVVDLFTGSGALGIEALSRGVECVVLVDKNGESLRTVRHNLARCRVDEARALVWKLDWRLGLTRLATHMPQVGWVMLDPPYQKNLWVPVLQTLQDKRVKVRRGIVCEHPRQSPLPASVGWFEKYKERAYGDILITLYRESPGSKDERE